MKEIKRIMLNVLAKTTKNVVEREKNYQSLCPTIFYQPKRPEKQRIQNANNCREIDS